MEFQCSKCDKRLRVPQHHVNPKVRCPNCGHIFWPKTMTATAALDSPAGTSRSDVAAPPQPQRTQTEAPRRTAPEKPRRNYSGMIYLLVMLAVFVLPKVLRQMNRPNRQPERPAAREIEKDVQREIERLRQRFKRRAADREKEIEREQKDQLDPDPSP